jgi:hypothetical protein
MKTYLANIIPRIQRYSKRLDQLTMLTNQHWISINDITDTKTVYIFDSNGELDVFENGLGIDSGTWRLLDSNSLKLRLSNNQTLLLKHGFFDENVIALKLDSTDRYAFFVNENKHRGELNTIKDIIIFLEEKYLKENRQPSGIGANQRSSLNEKKYGYRITAEEKKYNIVWGNHIEYRILYNDGRTSFVYKGLNTGKYFYDTSMIGQKYYQSFEDAVYNNYLYLKRF